MNIAICDDEVSQSEYLQTLVRQWDPTCEITRYASAEALLFAWADSQADILLLDILMDRMNGMELARTLRRRGSTAQVLFITGTPDFVFDGYDVEAISYLLKPVDQAQLFRCLDMAKKRLGERIPEIAVDTADGLRKLPLPEILYLESFGHTTVFHTEHGSFESRTGIQAWSERLESMGFYRLHRSYLIALAHVSAITKKAVDMDGGTSLPIPRGKWESVNKAWLDAFRNIHTP